MLVPLEWLGEFVDLSLAPDARKLAADFASIGLEEEDYFGPVVSGPLVVARVESLEKEEHSNGKTVNWCQVNVGEEQLRGIICGAHNFVAGDLVVAALPGAVLPGDFAIAARKTYGHVSDGMICSSRELGLGDDHGGIIVLSDWGLTGEPGDDAKALLGLDSVTLDVNVTPDRGYQLSMRGIAREYAMLKKVPFTDPADRPAASGDDAGFPVELANAGSLTGTPGCDRFTAVTVRGFDPAASTPFWMTKRLLDAGIRPVSLAVDVTNYVMIEYGQPLHAYDLDTLGDSLVVRRAQAGEKITTLDHVERTLTADDLLITDVKDGQSRTIGLAGVMGGLDTEVTDETIALLIEAAHFDPRTIARTARRLRLSSEASRRFERGVDPTLGPVAAKRCAELLVELGGGEIAGSTVVGDVAPAATLELPIGAASARVGVDYTPTQVVEALEAIGATVPNRAQANGPGAVISVTVPQWRPDLTGTEDLIEEVVRVNGYAQIPSILPQAPGGTGLTAAQKARRTVSNLLAALGLTEVLTYPFTSDARSDALLIPADDSRRTSVRLANPIAADQPLMRTNLLSTLVDAAIRNVGRGFKDVALFEAGLVTQPASSTPVEGITFEPGYHPTDDELQRIFDSVPAQPYHYAGVLTGHTELPGVWGAGRTAEAADAIDAVARVFGALGVSFTIEAAAYAPFHPGRCAAFRLADRQIAGHAGELHPKALENLGMPARTVAFEFNLDAVLAQPQARTWAGVLSSYPVARQDVALVVDEGITVGEVAAALREGAGEELENLELFDVYAGDQVGEGMKSLAFRLTFRAADRTMTADEASALRQAASDLAAQRLGARVRS